MRSGRRLGAWRGRGPWRSCRSSRRASCRSTTRCNGCCGRSLSGSGSSRRWRLATAWRYTNEIDILLVLAPGRVEVECVGIRHVAAAVVGYNRNVIAYLVLLRPAVERSKGTAHCYVRRPGNSGVGAVRIEQLRIGVVCGIPCVQPHRINPSIGRDADRTEIVPLVMVNWIVIDPVRRAKGYSAVGAAHEQHVRAIARTEWFHASHHVNVIVGRSTRAVPHRECLPCYAPCIYCAAVNTPAP